MSDVTPDESSQVTYELLEPDFAKEIIISEGKAYCLAEYLPLGLFAEGNNEREARDELMGMIWKVLAKKLEARLQTFERGFSIREMVQTIEGDYYSKNERPVRVVEEKVGVINIELVTPEEIVEEE